MGLLDLVAQGFVAHGPFVGTLFALFALTVWVIYWFSNKLIKQKDDEIKYLRGKLDQWEKIALANK